MINISPNPNENRAQNVNRREFLRTSTQAAAVTAALATLPLERFAHAAGSDTLRVGMIGCGGRNTGAGAQALHADKGARLVAMCDIFLDRVKEARNAIKTDLAKDGKADQVQVTDDHCYTGFDGYKKVIEA